MISADEQKHASAGRFEHVGVLFAHAAQAVSQGRRPLFHTGRTQASRG
jgi:hypothetical protein